MELCIAQLPELELDVRFHEPLRLSLAPRTTPVPTAMATGTIPKPVGRGRVELEDAVPEENAVVRGLGVYVWTSFVETVLDGELQCDQKVVCVA
jgi:hypothetical protein